jgi:ATP-dependent Clp protease ATP-binding subunit ClpA
MFLTTNQIAEFDIAIPSRIHVAIQYESLNQQQMEGIFKGFLRSLQIKGLIDNYDGILSWLRDDVFDEGLDGRQIRNIITTALSLARAEQKSESGKGKLAQRHLKSAFTHVKRFKNDFTVQMDRYKREQGNMIK